MRMWMINPKGMCRKHLLGEHVECHMFVGSMAKKISVKGYLEKGLLEIHNLRARHEELAAEMLERGMNHQSPLPKFRARTAGKVDVIKNLADLKHRCPECSERLWKLAFHAEKLSSSAIRDEKE